MLSEAVKKNQIKALFKSEGFKVGIEFEFYNQHFLQTTGRPSGEEITLIDDFVKVLNIFKNKNHSIMMKNFSSSKIHRTYRPDRIHLSKEIINDFDSRAWKTITRIFETNGVSSEELGEQIYYYISQSGLHAKNAIHPQDFNKRIFDKYRTNSGHHSKRVHHFLDLLDKLRDDEEIDFSVVKKYYSNSENIPRFVKNPKIAEEAVSKDNWVISADYSVPPSIGGIEFASPPMSPREAIDMTRGMFSYIARVGNTQSYTSELEQKTGKKDAQCGLHINLSFTPERMKSFDPLKFILFSNESQVNSKKLFGERADSLYINGFLEAIRREMKNMKDGPEIPDTFTKDSIRNFLQQKEETKKMVFDRYVENSMSGGIKSLQKMLQSDDFQSKYMNVNLSHYNSKNRTKRRKKSERIEIRYFGGQGYEKKHALFKRVLGELLYALDVATDKEKEKKEYYKKLYRLFSTVSK